MEEKIGEMQLPAIMLGGSWKDCYAIQLEGDCLEPEAHKGDWVIVRRYKEPKPGDWVIAKFDGDWCVKVMGEKRGELKSINPKYKPMVAKQELQIFGVVIKVLGDRPRRS